MTARLASLLATLGIFAGCDLDEAERLDLTRASSRGVEPVFEGISLEGGAELSLTRVLASIWDPEGARRWSLDWTDPGMDAHARKEWMIVGVLDGSEVLAIGGSGPWTTWIRSGPPEIWLDRVEEVRLRVDTLSITDYVWNSWMADLPQRIRDDRPALERVFSFAEGESRRIGDTVLVAVRNPGVNAIAVYSDYSGARQIGAYELLVPPGGRDTLRWLVVGAPSNDAWIDLGWGDWGSHERRSFRTP